MRQAMWPAAFMVAQQNYTYFSTDSVGTISVFANNLHSTQSKLMYCLFYASFVLSRRIYQFRFSIQFGIFQFNFTFSPFRRSGPFWQTLSINFLIFVVTCLIDRMIVHTQIHREIHIIFDIISASFCCHERPKRHSKTINWQEHKCAAHTPNYKYTNKYIWNGEQKRNKINKKKCDSNRARVGGRRWMFCTLYLSECVCTFRVKPNEKIK